MNNKRKTSPGSAKPKRLKELNSLRCKCKKNIPNPKYQRTLELFQKGGKYTVVQLTEILQVADPRSLIRRLRNDNIPICDYWEKSEFSKHKVYFIHTGTATEPSDNSGGQYVKE